MGHSYVSISFGSHASGIDINESSPAVEALGFSSPLFGDLRKLAAHCRRRIPPCWGGRFSPTLARHQLRVRAYCRENGVSRFQLCGPAVCHTLRARWLFRSPSDPDMAFACLRLTLWACGRWACWLDARLARAIQRMNGICTACVPAHRAPNLRAKDVSLASRNTLHTILYIYPFS